MEGDNGAMDTTQVPELITQLEAADPADAPDIADEVTATLAATLEDRSVDVPPTSDPAPDHSPGDGP